MRSRIGKPKTREMPILFNARDVDLSFTGPLINSSNCLRITVPKKDVQFWELNPGDEVHVRIDRVKREQAS